MKESVSRKEVSRTERTKSEVSQLKQRGKVKILQKVNKKDMEHGFVYIMKNVSMEGILKIGVSKDAVMRARQLRTTGVPTPFEIVYSVEVKRPYEIEKILHAFLNAKRVDPKREFFEGVSAEDVIRLIQEYVLPIFSHFNGNYTSSGSTMMIIDDEDEDEVEDDADDRTSS